MSVFYVGDLYGLFWGFKKAYRFLFFVLFEEVNRDLVVEKVLRYLYGYGNKFFYGWGFVFLDRAFRLTADIYE